MRARVLVTLIQTPQMVGWAHCVNEFPKEHMESHADLLEGIRSQYPPSHSLWSGTFFSAPSGHVLLHSNGPREEFYVVNDSMGSGVQEKSACDGKSEMWG
ncbi:hypothetical protein Q9966_012194 [Columba livia]|nr:hypothetical protein Q9966_012194 [Columba livia]